MRVHPLALVSFAAFVLVSCGGATGAAPAAPPCDEECRDGVAIKGLRETLKLAFNIGLQGKPVGAHDESAPCLLGGSVRIFGSAASNAQQGTTEMQLTYVLAQCKYLFRDDDAEDNYELTFTGTMTQDGILAVQPSATSAVVMKSEKMTISGTVYDPPLGYDVDCPIELGQNGNKLTGKVCGRTAETEL